MRRRYYWINTAEWATRTAHLSLELEGAYVRLCNEVHWDRETVISGERVFRSVFLCGKQKAAKLLAALAAAKMLEPLGEWTFRILKTRLARPSLPAQVRAAIYARDGFVCAYCETLDGPFDIDHIHPVIRGGSDDHENLCVACAPCNRSKGAKLLAEWL